MAKSKDKSVMLGWSGRWSDGSIGWLTNKFVSNGASGLETDQRERDPKRTTFERVRVTVEVLRRSDGRKITRKPKGAEP